MRNNGCRGTTLVHLVACLALGTMASAHAETLQVSNSNDAGAGSLRAAITAANASASDSTITFAPGTDGVAIVLASALPDLSDVGGALTIVGNGPAATLVDGAGLYRPLHFDGSNLDLSVSQLTFRNGFADQGQGGAIYFRGDAANAHLNLDTVEFDSNQATYGGGAVFVTATVTVDRCTFAYNASDNPGAALHGNAGQLDITNSVFVGNDGSGATILHFSSNAQARLVNLTLTQNAAHSGTVFVDQGASFSISNSLVVNNSNYDLATAPDGTVDLAQSFNNVFSKLEPDVLFAEGVNGNRLGVTAAYASALGNYGGPIRTVALLPGSPAIDAGSASVAGLPASDQRGQPRLGAPDVGAFESQGYVLAVAAGGTQSAEVDRHFAAPLRVAVNPNNALDPVEGGVVQFSAPGSGASAVLATPSASIGADGTAQTLAYANAQPGGPYNVAVNTSIATAAAFQLTNTSGECLGYAFPYTLAANDNAARVAELRQAIDCSNDNGLDDVIDLAGYTLNFDDAAWTDASTGASALPEVISDKRLGLRNGRLQRADNAPAFRFLQSDPAAALEIEQLQFVNGRTPHAGGAILAGGSLVVRDSRFESNHATTAGGAVSVGTTNRSVYFIGSTFAHNTSPAGAALALASAQALMSRSTLLANGDADTLSVVWSVGSLYLADSLLAQHNLAATGSALLQVDAAAEFRNITVADNHVDGTLMAAQPGNVIRAYNTIIWGNQYSALGAQSAFSLVQGVSGPGAYLSAQPPGFRDPANGDYRLDSGSPAIDAGNDGYIMPNLEDQDHDGTPDMIGTDRDGNPRLVDDATVADTGTSANAWPVVDLGAYERQLDSVAVGITVTQGAGLETSEAGATASFSLALNRYPGATVRVAVSSSDLTEGTVSPAYLEFTQADWNLPHVVTVTGVADSVIDGDVAYTVVIDAATSADAAYLGINPPDVDVINRDVLPTYRIGGSVTGLLGAGLTLQLSGPGLVTPETLAISANQPFTFAAMLASGVVYTVTASAQPGNPTQYCSIVNGSGTVGLADVSNIVVNCGAATTHRIGGTVSGLATGQAVVLQLNGGGDLTLTANGSYHFASQLEAGASFVVTVRSQPEGQLCTLSNASGTMAATDVDNVQVDCAPLLAELHLAVDDGYAYSRYGQVRDYFVTLSNTGNTAATNVAVSAQFSAAFDGGNVAWQCLGGGPGASCTAQGNGGFFDQASVPANSSVMWLVSVPVLAGSNAATATLTIGSPPPASAYALPANVSDSNTLVIFRDGLDVPYADGTQARADADLLAALGTDTGSASIAVPAATAEGLDVLRRVTVGAGRVEVQRLTRGTQSWVRLLRRDPNGQEHAGRWSALAPDARLVLGSLPLDAERRLLLLEGAAQPASLPLPTP